MYTITISVFFLIAAVFAAYHAGLIAARPSKSFFSIYGNPRHIRSMLIVAAIFFTVSSAISIGTLPTL